MNLNREELIWAAGFFDGEGYIGFTKSDGHNSRSVQLVVVQSAPQDKPPDSLLRFNSAVGNICRIHSSYPKDRLPKYTCRVDSFEYVQFIFSTLYPWLCSTKRNQGLEALKKYHSVPLKMKMGTDIYFGCGHPKIPENTYIRKSIRRTDKYESICRKCALQRSKKDYMVRQLSAKIVELGSRG